MNLLIFGATGSIGSHLVQQALEAGHQVTVLVRNPEKLAISHPALRIVQGDVLAHPHKIDAAMVGQDAVLVALGDGLRGKVRSQGTDNIVASMQRTGVNRLICQSTLGAGDSYSTLNLKWKLLFGSLLRKVMADHQRQEEIVQRSDLDWTIVRPSSFTDDELNGTCQHGFDSGRGLKLKIARADVAHFMLQQLTNNRYLRMTPALSC